MPKLPIINSQSQVSSQLRTRGAVINPNINRVGAETVKQEAKIQNIETAGKVIKAWSNAVDTMQLTKAKGNYEVKMADLENRAKLEPDYKNYEKYSKEADEIIKQSADGIGNPFLKSDASYSFKTDGEIQKSKINNLFRQKAIDYAKEIALPEAVDGLTRKKMNATPGEFAKADAELRYILTDNVNQGLITREDGNKFLLDSTKTIVENDIWTRPDFALKELERAKKGEYTGYSDLSSKDILDYTEKAKAREKQIKNEVKEAEKGIQEKANTELDDIQAQGKLTESYVRKQYENGNITFDQMNTRIKSLYTKEPKPLIERQANYVELIEKKKAIADKEWGWKNASFNDRANFRYDAMKALAEGDIDEKEYKDLMGEQKNILFDDPVFKSAINQIQSHSSFYGDKTKTKAELYSALMIKIGTGKTPDVAVKEIIAEKTQKDLAVAVNKPNVQIRKSKKTGEITYSYDNGVSWGKKRVE